MELKTHFIEEYKKMLTANDGRTMGQEGYSTVGHTMPLRMMYLHWQNTSYSMQNEQQRRKEKFQT